jgi:hypothetical protein
MKLIHWITLLAFAIFEGAYLINLREIGPDWMEYVPFAVVVIFVIGLLTSLWGTGINRWLGLLSVGFLGLIIGTSTKQLSDMDTLEMTTLLLHAAAVVAVAVFYFLAIKPMKNVSSNLKMYSALSLFANEASLVWYLASNQNIIVYWILVLATASLGVSFGLIFHSVANKS